MTKLDRDEGRKVYKENREAHFKFRRSYTDAQAKRLLRINITTLIYSIGILVAIGIGFHGRNPHAANEAIFLLIDSAILFFLCSLGFSKKIFKKNADKDEYYEVLIMFEVIGYMAWGFDILSWSLIDGIEPNYLPVIITYTLCALFFFFSVHHYVVLFLLSCTGTWIVLNAYATEVNYQIIGNSLLLGGVLTVGAILKYYSAAKEFAAKMKSIELSEQLEANNEELISINDNLLDMTEKLRDKNEKQRLFTASMNHELRSPLNGVIGLLQIVRDDGKMDAESSENIENALASSKTLLQIVNDLLDFAKLGEGEFKILSEPYDLREAIDTIEALNNPLAKEKGLDFIVNVDSEMPRFLLGDGVRVQQVITNLVSNGIKYTEKGFVKLEIKRRADKVRIEVSDSGQGLAPETMETMFDPFTRFNAGKNKKIQGTGLGLSIVKNLINLMDGDIWVESEVGKGSVFFVELPLVVSDANRKYGDAKEEKEKEEITVPDFTGRKFLCVDDNKVNLTVMKGLLKGTGAQITLMPDGESCLEEVSKNKYDIIYMDHLMPGMDGIETFKQIRGTYNLNTNTPVIMLTGNSSDEDLYLSIGLSGFISKPVIKDELYAQTMKQLL